jgi:hypothetical protein
MIASVPTLDLLAHNWGSGLVRPNLDPYFSPAELPLDCAKVISIYERTVRLSLDSKESGTGVILNNQWLLTCSHVRAG